MSCKPVIVSFDVETTGLVAGVDRVVELGAVAFQGEEILDTFSSLVNPGVPMPPAAGRVTGITEEMLAEAPPPAAALPGFLCLLGRGTPLDFSCHAPRQPRTARLLQDALARGTMVDISYRSSCGALTQRTIKPLSFSLVGGSVAVIAFCTLRNDTRTFFLDSITGARGVLDG